MQKKYGFLLSVGAILTWVALTSTAQAQAFPSTAEPSRVQEQIAPLQTPKAPEGVGVITPDSVRVKAPAGAEKTKFKLATVKIADMTAYTDADISPLYKGMVGETVSLADVYGLAEKLTAKYRNDGYVLTQVVVPPQTIESGHVRLRVVEGFVDAVVFQGKTLGDISYLQPYADKIKASRPLNAKTLERYLLLINDLSGMSAKAVLSPSPKTPGASNVTLVVEQKPVDASFVVDNRGSRYMGSLQFNAGARLNNALGLYEGVNLQAATAPDGWPKREMDTLNIGVSVPVRHEGTKVTLNGGITPTHPGYTLSEFDVKGMAHAINLEVMHPFIRSRSENLYAALKFNYLNAKREDNLAGDPIKDRLRVVRLNSTYQFTDRFFGVNTVNVEISKGFDVLGASSKGDANMTRADGDPEFFKGTAEASRLQRLTDMVDIFAGTTGQWSANTLLASEEFGVGGASYGSAYDSSEITGKNGLAVRLELRANPQPPLHLQTLQLYGFYDIGEVWDPNNAVGADRIRSIASTGAGFRMALNETFSASFEAAVPLTREVETAQNGHTPRLFGSLTARF
ncbi:MAG: ShlB/FhaC/HecB family hemolysin secretion/activation protein [Pseudomonadota bacterium]